MSDPQSWPEIGVGAPAEFRADDPTTWTDATTRLVDATSAEARAWENVSRALDRLASLTTTAELAAAIVRESLTLMRLDRAFAVAEDGFGTHASMSVGEFTTSEMPAIESALRAFRGIDGTRIEWVESGPTRIGAVMAPVTRGASVFVRIVARPHADIAICAIADETRHRPPSGELRALEFFAAACTRTFAAQASRAAEERARRAVVGENQHLRQLLGKNATTDRIVGVSRAAAALRRSVERLAGSGGRVLVTGESGTGKTLVTSVLHATGATSEGHLIRVRGDAGDASLLDSLLFSPDGTRLQSRFSGSTLHLDAVHALPPSTQDRLLEAIVSGEDGTVRILSETDRDLDERVLAGAFRRELLSVLRMVSIRMPRLSERPEDVPSLADAFASEAAVHHGRPPVTLTREARRALAARTWPANARELRECVERAVVLSDLPEIGTEAFRNAEGEPPRVTTLQEGPFRIQMDHLERLVVERVLVVHDWNISMGARSLDISRQHLHNLVRKHGLRRPSGDRRRVPPAVRVRAQRRVGDAADATPACVETDPDRLQ